MLLLCVAMLLLAFFDNKTASFSFVYHDYLFFALLYSAVAAATAAAAAAAAAAAVAAAAAAEPYRALKGLCGS